MAWDEELEDNIADLVCNGCILDDPDGDPCNGCPGSDIMDEICSMVIDPIKDLLNNLVE